MKAKGQPVWSKNRDCDRSLRDNPQIGVQTGRRVLSRPHIEGGWLDCGNVSVLVSPGCRVTRWNAFNSRTGRDAGPDRWWM